MHGSTLPVWLVVLVLGATLSFLIGFLNPFISKGYKEKIKKFNKKKIPELLTEFTVPLGYRFNRFSYMATALIVNFIVLVLFAFDIFSKANGEIGMNFFKLFIALFIIALFESLMVVISIALENLRVRLITKHYKMRYGVKIVAIEND